METQERREVATVAHIAEAIKAAVDNWPDLKCSVCAEIRPFQVTNLQVDYDSKIWNLDDKPWRVTGLQRLPAPGWVEISVEVEQSSSSRRSFCPSCAKTAFPR